MSVHPNKPPTDPNARQLMIVDDEAELLNSLIALFEKQYMVIFASSGSKAIELLQQGFTPQVILSDNRMVGISGIEFLAESTKYVPDSIRVIMTGFTDIRDILAAINQGHVYMYLTKPWQVPDLLQAIRICFHHYQVSTHNKRLVVEMEQKHELLRKLNEELYTTNKKLEEVNQLVYGDLLNAATILGSLIGAQQRYYYTNHAVACGNIVRHLAPMLEITGDRLNLLVIGALLHDVGKVELPIQVQGKKSDTLVGEELALYETHAERGADILRRIERFAKVAEIVEQHHERVDGSGFPRRLSGYQVSREAQIVGIVDIYHDIVSRIDPTQFFALQPDEVLAPTPEDLTSRQAAAKAHIQKLTNKFDPDIITAVMALAQSGQCPELKF